MSLTPEQNAAIARLKRLKLYAQHGSEEAFEAWARDYIASARARVDAALTKALAIICTSREEAATITRLLEMLGDPTPDATRAADLYALAGANKHLLSADLVSAMMTDMQDEVEAADPDAYRELHRVPLRPGVGDPSTVAEIDAAIAAILGG